MLKATFNSKILLGDEMKYLLLKLIKLYQLIPGPWHHSCNHYPTCSHYAYQAIEEYGVIKGTGLGLKRIIKCNPWGTISYDPIPKVKE